MISLCLEPIGFYNNNWSRSHRVFPNNLWTLIFSCTVPQESNLVAKSQIGTYARPKYMHHYPHWPPLQQLFPQLLMMVVILVSELGMDEISYNTMPCITMKFFTNKNMDASILRGENMVQVLSIPLINMG